jgi:methionine salvage enolase-phosphatase E1
LNVNTPSSPVRTSPDTFQRIQRQIAAAARWMLELHDDISDLKAAVNRRSTQS